MEGQLNLTDAIDAHDRVRAGGRPRLPPQASEWPPCSSARAAGTCRRSTSWSTGNRSRPACSTSGSTSSTTPGACWSGAAGPTSTCPSWRATSRPGCGTTSSSARGALGIPRGSIKATVLIETILAAFEMEEILYELREHSAGLNAGRWDYIFSAIKKFRNDADVPAPGPGPGDDDRALHARLHGAAGQDLPPPGRPRHRRHGRVHPLPAQPGDQRDGPGPGARGQGARVRRRLRRHLGGPPGPGPGGHWRSSTPSWASVPTRWNGSGTTCRSAPRAAGLRGARAAPITEAGVRGNVTVGYPVHRRPGCGARARPRSTT